MNLRSNAPTIGAMVGNDILERAEALVAEMRVKPHLREDARQEAALAMLEGRDPEDAVRKFVSAERSLGMTGGGTRPTVFRLTPEECGRLADPTSDAPDIGAVVETAATKLEVAGAVLVNLSKRQRKMLVLRAMGWTEEEIAQHLGIRKQAVSQALGRIEAKSKDLMRQCRPTSSEP